MFTQEVGEGVLGVASGECLTHYRGTGGWCHLLGLESVSKSDIFFVTPLLGRKLFCDRCHKKQPVRRSGNLFSLLTWYFIYICMHIIILYKKTL